jgi:hypothetical protein
MFKNPTGLAGSVAAPAVAVVVVLWTTGKTCLSVVFILLNAMTKFWVAVVNGSTDIAISCPQAPRGNEENQGARSYLDQNSE